jgi:hypothetical protein
MVEIKDMTFQQLLDLQTGAALMAWNMLMAWNDENPNP